MGTNYRYAGQGVMRNVVSCVPAYKTKAKGFAPACTFWRLTFDCGHAEERPDSKAHVNRAKCKDCKPETTGYPSDE